MRRFETCTHNWQFRVANCLMSSRWLAPAVLCVVLIGPPAAQADGGVTYSPSPGFAGSTEQFGACGFQQGETVDLTMDGGALAQATTDGGGCIQATQQMALDIAQTTHLLAAKGEKSGVEQDGVYLVMPPTITGPPAPVLPGGIAIGTGQFFAPTRMVTLIPGGLPPVPASAAPDGAITIQLPVPPNTPPGAYPVLFQDTDNPFWLQSQPTLIVTVLPMPSDAPPQPAAGSWTLNASTTLTGSGTFTGHGSGSDVAQFTVSGGQVKGQGQLSISIDMGAGEANCHGESAPAPFDVGGTQDGSGMLHLTFTGIGASITITVTCNNGFSMPFTLPGGASGAAPTTFDIAAQDGTKVDLDGSNPFVMVPTNFTGQTHVVLTQS
jgi:hypothetical protein